MKSVPSICIVLVLAFLPLDAFGQSTPQDQAENMVRRGLELRRTGDDEAALAEYERAQTLAPSPRIQAQVGLALQALGRWREAESVDLQVLSEDSDPWVREHEDLLRESVATAQYHLAWLSVDCNVPGADLLVNGATVGKLPMSAPIRVTAGSVVLQLRAEGHESVLRTIDLAEGTRARETFVLVASPPSIPIRAPSGERILAPSAMLVPDDRTTRRAVGWATLVAGGAVAAGGIAAAVVRVMYSAKYNDDSRFFAWPLTRDERCGTDRGIAEAAGVTSVVALVGGGFALATGIYLVAESPARPTRARMPNLACIVGPGSVGCSGVF